MSNRSRFQPLVFVSRFCFSDSLKFRSFWHGYQKWYPGNGSKLNQGQNVIENLVRILRANLTRFSYRQWPRRSKNFDPWKFRPQTLIDIVVPLGFWRRDLGRFWRFLAILSWSYWRGKHVYIVLEFIEHFVGFQRFRKSLWTFQKKRFSSNKGFRTNSPREFLDVS